MDVRREFKETRALGWVIALALFSAPVLAEPQKSFELLPDSRAGRSRVGGHPDSRRSEDASGAPEDSRRRELVPSAPVPSGLSASERLATEYVRRAESSLERGDVASALTWYTTALSAHASFGPALLGLARVRVALGDLGEAERLYTRAIRLPHLAAEALAARGALRAGRGEQRLALLDLEAALVRAPENTARWLALSNLYAKSGAWPAALSVWRRLLSLAERAQEPARESEARMQIQALLLLCAEADPVQMDEGHWVRKSLAAMARRGP